MSITVQYLFNADVDLSVLAQNINKTLGCSLAPYEGDSDDLYCRFLGMEFSLTDDHGLKNDGEMNFHDFRYELTTRTPVPDSDLRTIQIETMAIVAFVLHKRLKINRGILTFDIQRLLARYDVVDGRWTNTISDMPFRLPNHLQDINKRIVRLGWRIDEE